MKRRGASNEGEGVVLGAGVQTREVMKWIAANCKIKQVPRQLS